MALELNNMLFGKKTLNIKLKPFVNSGMDWW